MNTVFNSGWFVCPCVLGGFCTVQKSVVEFDSRKGGTNRYGKYTAENENPDTQCQVTQQKLSIKYKQSITDAAALAVVLELRPLGFAENKEGIGAFWKPFFMQVGVFHTEFQFDDNRTFRLGILSKNQWIVWSENFGTSLQISSKNIGAITIDGLSLKLQGRYYYDFSIHHIDMNKQSSVLTEVKYSIKNSTVLSFEVPRVYDADNIRKVLNQNLREQVGTSFSSIQKQFTLATDGAAVMARLAGSSVSHRIAVLDERWICCIAHILNKITKKYRRLCKRSSIGKGFFRFQSS